MTRTSWVMAALTFMAFGPLTTGVSEARAQWVEVSTVRYGLLGRPRAVERYWVPAVNVVPTTTVVPTSYYVTSAPVVATTYVRTIPTTSVILTSYGSVVPSTIPTTYVTTSYPVVSEGYISAVPVVRTYVPTVRVIETQAVYFP